LRDKLPLFKAVSEGEEKTLSSLPNLAVKVGEKEEEEIKEIVTAYQKERKSPTSARVWNAILPGAGYAYVGQYETAATSFAINALFIIATVELFSAHQPAAACIALGLEVGWYAGGIMGAGLAAEEYNRRLYETLGKAYLERYQLFPLLMIRSGW
jgi:hypothetical protein